MNNEKEKMDVSRDDCLGSVKDKTAGEKQNKISLKASPEILRLMAKSRRWRENPNEVWKSDSESDGNNE